MIPSDNPDRPAATAIRYGLFTVAAGLLFGMVSAQVANHGPLTSFDERFAPAAYQFAKDNPAVYDFALWVTDLGGGMVRTGVVVFAALLVLDGRCRVAVLFGISQWWFPDLVGLAKDYFERPRPVVPEVAFLAGGYAYPSGHAAGSLATYGTIALLCGWNWPDRRVRIPIIVVFSLLILCVGISRLLLGVHWFSDVLGGYLIAAAYVAGVGALMKLTWAGRKKSPEQPDGSPGL